MADGSSIAVTLNHSAVVYDKGRNVFYAAIPPSDVSHGNSIATISANTGAVSYSSAIGLNPNVMAISADCSTLYVGLYGSNSVVRIALPGMTVDGQIPLGTSNYAESISVSPKSANTVAVSLANAAVSPRHSGVALYTNLVKHTQVTQGFSGSNLIAFDSTGDWIYGVGYEVGSSLRKIAVSASGLSETSSTSASVYFNLSVVDGFMTTGAYVYAASNFNLLSVVSGAFGCTKLPGVAKIVCISGSPYDASHSGLKVVDTSAFATLATPSITNAYYTEVVPGAAGQVAIKGNSTLLLVKNANLN